MTGGEGTRTPARPLPAPMLATAGPELPRGAGWAYEMKWDGYRAIVEVHHGQVRVVSRRGVDVTARYPELEPLAAAVGVDDVVLDGELVVLDDAGHASFAAIQAHEQPAVFVAFDVLRLDGRDLSELPWRERRRMLERLALDGSAWQTPPVLDGATEGAADVALETARDLGFEGVIAKRVDAPYRPGRRTTAWRKRKLRTHQELVVGGWLPGAGRLSGTLGSLLVGFYASPGATALTYAGRVGSGLDDAARDALARRLVGRPTSPFIATPRLSSPVWVEPDVVAEIEFSEWTADGVLRQPVFLGLRTDKLPSEVTREA